MKDIEHITGLDLYLEFAKDCALNAGELLLRYFRTSEFKVDTKLNITDVVTTADRESEFLIKTMIKKRFPDHGILAEETGESKEGGDWRWVIDPLDGTTNFSQGLPVFCVSIALEYKGEPVVGVVYAPYLREMFYAVKGLGAYLNGDRITCGKKVSLAESVVATGFPYDKVSNSDNNTAEVSRIVPKIRGLRRAGSAAVDMAYVAAGYYDAYWELNLKRWDVAAGIVIAKESGANICSIREDRNQSVLVSSPGIYEGMLSLLDTPFVKPL